MKYFRVELIRLSDLIPHELVDPLRVKVVKYSIMNLHKVLRPVIVDLRTGVVIDGHHRVKALKELGFKYVPAITINYLELREPKPFTYYVRLCRGRTEEFVKGLIKECDGCGSNEVLIKYSVGGGEVKSVIIESDLRLVNEVLSKSVRAFNASMIKNVIIKSLKLPYVIIKPLRITHHDVIKVAYEGKPYPPKTTYHITKFKEVIRPTEVGILR